MTAPSPEPRSAAGLRRVRVRVEGVVQGVGFRPYVHRLAAELGVAGFVRNDERGVVIEAEGAPEAVEALLARLPAEAPPMAVVDRVTPRGHPPARGGRVRDRAQRAGCVRRRARLARRGDVRGVPARAVRSGRPAPSLSVHQLHGLRPALHDRARRPVRPAADHDGRLRDVRALRGRVPRPGRPPLPRPAERVPGLRAAARPSTRRGRRRAGRRRDRRGQGDRRVPPRVRGVGRARGRDAARAQAPRGEAVRADGAGSRGGRAAGGPGPGRDGPAARARPPDRARAEAAGRARGRRGRARARPSSA